MGIIENQRIAKRQHSRTSNHTNKSAGFDSGFMSHFRQNPVRSRKKSKTSDSSLFMTFIRLGSRKKSDRRIY
ncbi:MAG: hypothetical protein LBU66_05815, partial [Treponema sp.]|nr:hypothetical protein [Treponema sp.]